MATWVTGYLDLHSPTGIQYEKGVTRDRCQKCSREFESKEDLRLHQFVEHPTMNPRLFIKGMEVGTQPLTITSQLSTDDIGTQNCDQIWLNDQEVTTDQFSSALSQYDNHTCEIQLKKENIKSEFVLEFRVASEHDLSGVEQYFSEFADCDGFGRQQISDFIEIAVGRFETAKRYLDGISHYLYGVLDKEETEPTQSENYVHRFNRAAVILDDFDRPLANAISAVIAFNLNQFDNANLLRVNNNVGLAARCFTAWLKGESYARTESNCRGGGKLLIDEDSQRIISWFELFPELQFDQMRSYIEKASEFDRSKMKILLAQAYAEKNQKEEAKLLASDLRSVLPFDKWAEDVLKSYE